MSVINLLACKLAFKFPNPDFSNLNNKRSESHKSRKCCLYFIKKNLMASAEAIDPYIATALKLLHSSAPDSAEKMRLMLDNEISKNHEKS